MTEAPRWRLTNPHYLKVFELPDGTRCEWEHKETTRETGRTVRKLFPVPILLNPSDPADCNYSGECIVAHKGESNLHNDIIFEGDPTSEMEPLNDVAQALTDAMRHKWNNPIESLPANGGMTSAESAFMAKMMEAFARTAPPPIEPTTINQAQFDELKAQVAALTAALAAKTQGPTSPVPERRV